MKPGVLLATVLVLLVSTTACGSFSFAFPSRTPTAIIYPTFAPSPTLAPATTARPLLPTAILTPSPTVAPRPPTPTISPTATTAPPVEVQACRGGDKVVALLLDPRLVSGIRAGLDQFSNDLCKDGYTVVQRIGSFATPPEARAYLAKLYAQTQQKLIGAIIVGNVPRAYQWVTLKSGNPNIPSTSEEVISFQYYADLNGAFQASPNYKSPGKRAYSYDVHGGDMNWEIWLGVLPLYKGDVAKTTDALNRYFAKNHAYRAGQSALPRAFLEVSEHFKSTTAAQDTQFLDSMRSGTYAWKPFSTANNARFYFDTKTPNLSLDQGYADLAAGVADFAVLDAHGFWGASGKLTIAWVESKPVRTMFFWSNGCAVGNLDQVDNFLTSVVYSPTSMVLVAKGTTNDSGGMGNNANGFFGANIAAAMSRKMSFGEAILSHVNVPLINPWAESREFHFATTIVLGDPTLRLR
jgi:hypothetical protein